MSVSAAVSTPSPQTYQFDLDHVENLTRAASALTIDPLKNILYYVFPFLGAYSSSYVQLRENDVAQEAILPDQYRRGILNEVKQLINLANVRRKIVPYAALNHHFSSCGGSLSVTSPALFIPYQHLLRPSKSPFGQERPEERLDQETWFYTDHQTRFLIAREIQPIKENNALLRIAIKISLVVAMFLIYASPVGWIAGVPLITGAIAIYLLSERMFEGKMDIAGAKLLAKRIGDPQKAFQVAIDTLEKMKKQNLERRTHSRISRLYITKSGNNVLDLNHPFLSTRIERLREYLNHRYPPKTAVAAAIP